MTARYVEVLTGGHPNSLGRTQEVVDHVRADRSRLAALFVALDSPDQLVRLRVSDALEKVCREQPTWLLPYIDRLIDDVGLVEQPSVQWHVAQMLDHLRADLSLDQARRATVLLKHNLADSSDWIVLNVTMDVLTRWAHDEPKLARWLTPQLLRLQNDRRASVAKRATRRQLELERPRRDGTS